MADDLAVFCNRGSQSISAPTLLVPPFCFSVAGVFVFLLMVV